MIGGGWNTVIRRIAGIWEMGLLLGWYGGLCHWYHRSPVSRTHTRRTVAHRVDLCCVAVGQRCARMEWSGRSCVVVVWSGDGAMVVVFVWLVGIRCVGIDLPIFFLAKTAKWTVSMTMTTAPIFFYKNIVGFVFAIVDSIFFVGRIERRVAAVVA